MTHNAVPQIAHDIIQGYKNSPKNLWPTYDGKFYLNRAKFVTSSQVGNCERWTWFDNFKSRNDHPALIPTADLEALPSGVTPDGWGYFSRGHSVERWIVDMLRASDSNWKYSYLGEDQRSFYSGNRSGTPDGMAYKNKKHVMLEFKSYDPRSNTYKFPKKAHKTQVQQNMDLVSECLDIEIEETVVYYNDASNYAECRQFTETRDDKVIQSLRDKSDRIMSAESADEMAPEGLYTGQCSLCPFTSQCSEHVKQANVTTQQARRRRRLADNVFKKKRT